MVDRGPAYPELRHRDLQKREVDPGLQRQCHRAQANRPVRARDRFESAPQYPVFVRRGSHPRIPALRFERQFAVTYTRCTSIPRSRNGVIALSEARLSVISMSMSEIGQISAGVTIPILLESATTIVCLAC